MNYHLSSIFGETGENALKSEPSVCVDFELLINGYDNTAYLDAFLCDLHEMKVPVYVITAFAKPEEGDAAIFERIGYDIPTKGGMVASGEKAALYIENDKDHGNLMVQFGQFGAYQHPDKMEDFLKQWSVLTYEEKQAFVEGWKNLSTTPAETYESTFV